MMPRAGVAAVNGLFASLFFELSIHPYHRGAIYRVSFIAALLGRSRNEHRQIELAFA